MAIIIENSPKVKF